MIPLTVLYGARIGPPMYDYALVPARHRGLLDAALALAAAIVLLGAALAIRRQ